MIAFYPHKAGAKGHKVRATLAKAVIFVAHFENLIVYNGRVRDCLDRGREASPRSMSRAQRKKGGRARKLWLIGAER